MLKQLEILLRKFLLMILAGNRPKQRIKSIPKDSVKKILLIRLNRIGDALVTTPLLSLLKNNLNCSIDILADKKNYFIFEGNPSVDNLYIFKKGLKGFHEFVKTDKSNGYDLIIDAHDDVSTTVTFLIELARSKYKLGLEKKNSSIFTTTVPRPDSTKVHVVERISSLAKALGIDYKKEQLRIVYPLKNESKQFAKEFIDKNNLREKFLIGINISAGSDARFWGIERFTKLVNYFKNFDVSILLLTAEKDLDKAMEISASSGAPLFMSNDFNRFASMISMLDFLFTPDTSVVHLASAYQIPLFGIYVKYQTDDIIWYPYNCKYDAVVTTEPDFTNLSFDSVIKKLDPFFGALQKPEKN